ncbi:hypothetical protein SERLA73DRAFT_185648 [Serpula lacrymans var. lacrymans S7.3]|uniref:UFSP1/2/DUB catalytic domain-containing protein n=2 Tax=Serpula lacrymans var. lacrymans TaxID=341189 RepID=F8Q666_SERL3|nr:uncharacterized protein SERLADRAFT_474237 [Serpula lacrymans var. lacrymans S7.9]EGN96104.1 hypothetical protein SERLA73DRAFT_185648 [Serpula lacrymans var. lacrymans S7.3]EGO21624.1 hypothetical protein SERLADRAFT_474237 [Serpula lacrymans var. lacrymans S7.9]
MSPRGGHDDGSDDVQILYETHAQPSEPFMCQLCRQDLTSFTAEQRETHYFEKHKMESDKPASYHAKPVRPRNKLTFSTSILKPVKQKYKELLKDTEEDMFWYPSQSQDPPPNFSPGLITVLKHALKRLHQKGTTRRAVLCYERTVHVGRESFDAGWGCGYRNFLMACTALMDQQKQTLYSSLLEEPISPGVRNLQLWIEGAWQAGYDRAGAKDLKHNLCGTKKFIGTAELYVAFTCRGIPSQLVDFDLRKSPRGVDALTNWVVEYFSPQSQRKSNTVDDILRGASPVIATDRMPLILQHDGHSRTIVGYELTKNGTVNLLIFDPSLLPKKTLRKTGISALTPHRSAFSAQQSNSVASSCINLLPLSKRNISKQKRKASPPFEGNKAKRLRSTPDGDDDVIIIDEDISQENAGTSATGSSHSELELDPQDVVKFFRVNNSRLGKKDQYQILYFPMEDPWDEKERSSRKEVTSTKVC